MTNFFSFFCSSEFQFVFVKYLEEFWLQTHMIYVDAFRVPKSQNENYLSENVLSINTSLYCICLCLLESLWKISLMFSCMVLYSLIDSVISKIIFWVSHWNQKDLISPPPFDFQLWQTDKQTDPSIPLSKTILLSLTFSNS